MTLGTYLQKRRVKTGLTQTQVARALGLRSGQSVSNIERDKAPLPGKYVRRVARLYKVKETAIARAWARDLVQAVCGVRG